MMLESRSGPGSSVDDFKQGEVLQAMDALICPLQKTTHKVLSHIAGKELPKVFVGARLVWARFNMSLLPHPMMNTVQFGKCQPQRETTQ